MLVDHAVVRLFAIEVLHQVVPHMPFPNNLATGGTVGLDFDHVIRHKASFSRSGSRPSAIASSLLLCSHAIISRLPFWHGRDIVVITVVLIGVTEIP